LSTPLNALYIAGGPTSRGSLRKIRQYRGQQLVREVDLYDFLLRGIRSDVEKLQAGDTILVPPVGPEVAVAGMVRRPAVYELKSDTNIQDVLELAGGVLVSANLNQIEVERIEAHQRRVSLSVNLPVGAATKSDVAGGGYSEAGALGSFRLQDGDKVRVSSILPYSNETVFLEGHVFRPGKYSYRPGMKISDVVRSYDDALPEPADHAEIVRLTPPDYRPATIEVDMRKALDGTADPELRPFDTVRIFGRYEIDPPKVAIFGEVLRPGEYPLAHDLTAAALVRMAGGFKRSALKDSADLSSYVIQNGQKILTKQRTILIGDALSGQTDADVNLKPGDVLTIRQLTGWADIGSSVTIQGEVVHAGTYGIQEGERLSSVLERAGGFRSIAFPAGAVLERVEVRQLEDKNRTELIRQVESAAPTFKVSPGKSEDQAALMQAMQQQQEQVVTTLRKQPASGRLVINISADINRWKNTPADIELRADDVLVIPKRPDFVLINGQVYNPSAITYAPGKDAGWYLRQAGGTNELANKKSIFIIRANGSVVGSGTAKGWFKGDVLSTRMQPGDTVVVPQKTIGGSSFWKQLVDTAQLTSALAIAARVATSF
jgi:protein involved in polysaccharide export with SLBB domain